ncbi:type II toxin-antitoxin system VapC family toxin [Sulfuritalea sp.]|uniref:type II toxin-antitoxin system VapC family toxin n=1 Tax=Sulfuritalea sp. TaxID=2480090 RepID=UPI00286DD15B|nr:type II toxin-antitoxin system VapC family toxin [Sulfuritalea sp.]
MSARLPLVIDCSAAIPWFLDDEANAWSEGLLDALPRYSLHVPALWHLEFANVLLTAQRRKRINAKDAKGLLARASRLPLVTDGRVVPLVEIADLAEAHGITTYDAAYLELATRLSCPLATQDKALAKAAKRLGFLYA